MQLKGMKITWDIRDKDLPKNSNLFSDFDLWPDGHVQRVYDTRQCPEALKHVTGWAMRNTNNHNIYVLKKSCLGVLICSRMCWRRSFSPASSAPSSSSNISNEFSLDSSGFPSFHNLSSPQTPSSCFENSTEPVQRYECYRPAICDKARTKQLEKPCPMCGGKLELKACGGQCGFPVTHFWRSDGHVIYFQGKGKHDHPRPSKFWSSSERKRKRKQTNDFLNTSAGYKKIKKLKPCQESQKNISTATTTVVTSAVVFPDSSTPCNTVNPSLNSSRSSFQGHYYDDNSFMQHFQEHDMKSRLFHTEEPHSTPLSDLMLDRFSGVQANHSSFGQNLLIEAQHLNGLHSKFLPNEIFQDSFLAMSSNNNNNSYNNNSNNSSINNSNNNSYFTDEDYKDALEVLLKNLSDNKTTGLQRASINCQRDIVGSSSGCHFPSGVDATFASFLNNSTSGQFNDPESCWRSNGDCLASNQNNYYDHYFDELQQTQRGSHVNDSFNVDCQMHFSRNFSFYNYYN